MLKFEKRKIRISVLVKHRSSGNGSYRLALRISSRGLYMLLVSGFLFLHTLLCLFLLLPKKRNQSQKQDEP